MDHCSLPLYLSRLPLEALPLASREKKVSVSLKWLGKGDKEQDGGEEIGSAGVGQGQGWGLHYLTPCVY